MTLIRRSVLCRCWRQFPSTRLTVATLYRLRAGSILAVVANRFDDTFQVAGVGQAVTATSRAALLLAEMTREKAAAGVNYLAAWTAPQIGTSCQSHSRE